MSDSATPQIISHYQVNYLLGVGAMGSVYLGIDHGRVFMATEYVDGPAVREGAG